MILLGLGFGYLMTAPKYGISYHFQVLGINKYIPFVWLMKYMKHLLYIYIDNLSYYFIIKLNTCRVYAILSLTGF